MTTISAETELANLRTILADLARTLGEYREDENLGRRHLADDIAGQLDALAATRTNATNGPTLKHGTGPRPSLEHLVDVLVDLSNTVTDDAITDADHARIVADNTLHLLTLHLRRLGAHHDTCRLLDCGICVRLQPALAVIAIHDLYKAVTT
jgi:hypothetical protein